MDYDPEALEEKWRGRWRESGRYEVDPDPDAESTFITVPYPYPSGGMHIGHARTYTVPDVYARYRRLQGDNVLFPIAWHVTGTPIIGAVERLKKGEQQQLSVLRDTYGVPEETLQDLETPMGFARYFIENHYKHGMQRLGLSIDWRREFTTNDDRYSKFITWQYETLKERGLLEKGLHPVNYCTNERQPVTTHDLLEGEEAEFQEYTLIKFGYAGTDGDGTAAGGTDGNSDGGETAYAPMATLRPETVRGVTNAFVDPQATYVRATVDGETWYISAAATEKFELQERSVTVHEEFPGETLVGDRVDNPVTGEAVLILPATFVDADNATGVVMSVPGHSPDDWIALEEAKADADRMAEYGIDPEDVRDIEPRSILTIDDADREYGQFPARDAVERYGVESQTDPALEDATQELYNDEFNHGRLIDAYGEFAGEVIRDVRDDLRTYYQQQGAFDAMYEFSEEVVCRCGGDVEVAKQETWFLRYNDPDWSAKAHRAVERLDTIPEDTRKQYDDTIEWLEEWPCIRNYGLGTKLPWDREFVIEPLSDSTIYMAYYTIAHRIDDVPVEELDRDFFDTLFYGPEAAEDPSERALDLREEWDYWYPVDYRCSAHDLIRNHLTFFLYHHAELFEEDDWPRGITTMGMGLLEGIAMSSSKGHVVLPGEAIDSYGADTVRFFLLNSTEPWGDYDWRAEDVENTRNHLGNFWDDAAAVIKGSPGQRELEHADRWLLAKLQATIEEATDAMERFETRSASQAIFYRFSEPFERYVRRADGVRREDGRLVVDRPGAQWTLREVLRTRLRMLAPFVPFMANELHERLTGDPAEDAAWPSVDPAFRSRRIVLEERLIDRLADDVREVAEVTDTDPDRIRVYVAADWKREVFDAVVEHGPDVGRVMSAVMEDERLRERGDAVNDLVQDLVAFVRGRSDEELRTLQDVDERAVYERATDYLAREFDAAVELAAEDDPDRDDPADKAGDAQPFRPAIHLVEAHDRSQ